MMMRRSIKCLPLFIAMGITGCTVGPDYQRPVLDIPALFRGEEYQVTAPKTESTVALGDVAWWQVFSDPVLIQLINDGLANNHDLRIAAARVDQYRAQAGVVHGALFPQIDAGLGHTSQNNSLLSDPSSTATDDTYRNWDGGVQVSWELDLFGRLRRQDEATIALWLATEEGRRGVVVTLVSDIASAYFTLRQYDLELEIAKRTLVANTEQVELYRSRLEGGSSNRLEVDQAEANRALTASTIPDFERRIALQENLISLLTGRNPGPVKRGQTLNAQSMPPVLPVGLPLQLLDRRPDVLQAEQVMVAANADVGAAKALFFPSIGITGMAGGLSHDFSDLGRSDAAIWSLGAGITQPLFKGGAIRFNYEAAQAQFQQALEQYQKTVQNSFRETADAIVTIEKLRKAREEIEKMVVALQDASDLARARYDGGLSSYLDILIVDQRLFEAELKLAELRGAEFTAMADLYRTLGGGWQVNKQPAITPESTK
ncbi:MAG TPA: efflux transporter outer membrane subunit [Pseudomonadales bacterium]|nr:efflux transporter outer membrane subunit [Pseudomonadales bacterium]